MTWRFYRHDPGQPAPAGALPPDAELWIWCPAEHGLPPRGSRRPASFAWWAFDRLGVFAHRGFTELSIRRGGGMLHRLIVTPRWRRFPFMADDDLQLGDLWTSPDARGQGLARAAIAAAHYSFPDRRFWYVVEEGNTPSIALIEACGYRLAGQGRRTAPFGIRSAGRFVLDQAGMDEGRFSARPPRPMPRPRSAPRSAQD